MRIKGIKDEDFINYKAPSMFISTCFCSFKCGIKECQNSPLALSPIQQIDDNFIIKRYLNNPITKAIVFGGLEPLDQIDEIYNFISLLRHNYKCNDYIIIYTGYEENEVITQIKSLKQFDNIIIKFGRYVPNEEKHYDNLLGIYLASQNQYAKELK